MDWLSIVQLAIQYGPLVKAAIDEATSNDNLATKIKSMAPSVGQLVQNVGAQLFPQASSTLQTVGGAIAAFDPNTTKWLQGSLNVLLKPSPNLTVDGIYGAKTKAAVQQLQTQLGLSVDGIAGQLTQAAIQAALAKLPAI